MENLDSFLTTVDEFVDDENKIVTCKWLSRQLVLHVNQARKVLEAYISGKKDSGINVVYTLIGRDSSGMCIKVVKDGDLDSAKAKLKQVISVSIYSIQKAKLQDSSILYAADYDSNRENLHENSRFGGITYDGAKRLSREEIKQKTTTTTPVPQADPAAVTATAKKPAIKTPQQKTNFFAKVKTSPPTEKKESGDAVTTKPPVKAPESKDESPPAKKQKKPSGMDAFMSKGKTDPFAKSQSRLKPAVKKEPEEGSKEPEKLEKDVKKELKGPEPKTRKGAKTKKEPSPELELDDDLRIDDFPSNKEDEEENDDDFVAQKSKKTSKSKSKRENSPVSKSKSSSKERKSSSGGKAKHPPKPTENSKKSRRKDSNDLPAKKRRRIQAVSSSSEDEDEADEEMDVIPPSPPPVAEPVIEKEEHAEKSERIVNNGPKNKRMKKVLKTKTYEDDDGCMVTQKVWEYESCSSDEENVPTNENAAVAKDVDVKKKKFPSVSTAAQKKPSKQSSIMGFFKKK